MPKATDSNSAPLGPEGAGYMTARLLADLRALVAEHLPAGLFTLRRIRETDADDPSGRTRADLAELTPRAAAFEGYLINVERDGFLLTAHRNGETTATPDVFTSLRDAVLAISDRLTPLPLVARVA